VGVSRPARNRLKSGYQMRVQATCIIKLEKQRPYVPAARPSQQLAGMGGPKVRASVIRKKRKNRKQQQRRQKKKGRNASALRYETEDASAALDIRTERAALTQRKRPSG